VRSHFSPFFRFSSPNFFSCFSPSPFSTSSRPLACSSLRIRRLSLAPVQGAKVEPTVGANDTPEPPSPRTERWSSASASGGRCGGRPRDLRRACSACLRDGRRDNVSFRMDIGAGGRVRGSARTLSSEARYEMFSF